MDTSLVIVLEDNWWHSVKRVLSSVYLNWQQLEVLFILIYQLESWSNWIGDHFYGALLSAVVLTQANANGLPDIRDFTLPEQHVDFCASANCMWNVFPSRMAAVYISLHIFRRKESAGSGQQRIKHSMCETGRVQLLWVTTLSGLTCLPNRKCKGISSH